jgi:MFS family permease
MNAPLPAAMRVILVARGLRAVVDGYVAVLLPAYLLALGFADWQVGVLSTATLLGSAAATLALGAWGQRFASRSLLLAAALLMSATGLLLAGGGVFGWLLLVAFVGTLNPSSGDVSVFLPLEHARIAALGAGEQRTALFARYSLTGALCAALGALLAGAPEWVGGLGVAQLDAFRAMFLVYAAVGGAIWLLYRRLPGDGTREESGQTAALGPSRPVVLRLAALFSVDAFGGALVVNSLLALWLFRRFELTLTDAGQFFFWAGLLSALSQLAAPHVARHIGLLNTMVFTHIPANIALIAAAFAPSLELALGLLFLRAALSQMDVPTRSAYVMSVVTPAERTAAASFTAVPRSLAAALAPTLGGALLASGALVAPLVAAGVLKIAYDLTLWRMFRGQAAQG